MGSRRVGGEETHRTWSTLKIYREGKNKGPCDEEGAVSPLVALALLHHDALHERLVA